MNAMGMDDVKVTSVVDEEGALSINMEGSNMGILIGKRGQTLILCSILQIVLPTRCRMAM